MPATSFCEYADTKLHKTPIWSALSEERPLFAPIHAKAVLVILTTSDEVDCWLQAEPKGALALQRPMADDALQIVARVIGQTERG